VVRSHLDYCAAVVKRGDLLGVLHGVGLVVGSVGRHKEKDGQNSEQTLHLHKCERYI
jgi:hypothetical protein